MTMTDTPSEGTAAVTEGEPTESLEYRSHDSLRLSEDNCRKTIDAKELTTLAESIAEWGILQSLEVHDDGEIIAGHRRWLAVEKLIGDGRLPKGYDLPCIVLHNSPKENAAVRRLIENLARTDLTPIEEAQGYYGTLQAGMSQADLARAVGKSASHVSKRLSLLRLDDKLQRQVATGSLPIKLAEGLAQLTDPNRVERVLEQFRDEYYGGEDEAFAELELQLKDQKAEVARAKVDKELIGLGLEPKEAQPPEGTRWEYVDRKAWADYGGSIPKGATAFLTSVSHYNGTVVVELWKLAKISDKEVAEEAEHQAALEGRRSELDKRQAQLKERQRKEAALGRARAKAKREAVAAAAKRPKKADVLGWALDALLHGATRQPINKVICDTLELDVPIREEKRQEWKDGKYVDTGKTTKHKEYDKAITAYLKGGEPNRLRVALVMLADEWSTRKVVEAAVGYDEKKVKVG